MVSEKAIEAKNKATESAIENKIKAVRGLFSFIFRQINLRIIRTFNFLLQPLEFLSQLLTFKC